MVKNVTTGNWRHPAALSLVENPLQALSIREGDHIHYIQKLISFIHRGSNTFRNRHTVAFAEGKSSSSSSSCRRDVSFSIYHLPFAVLAVCEWPWLSPLAFSDWRGKRKGGKKAGRGKERQDGTWPAVWAPLRRPRRPIRRRPVGEIFPFGRNTRRLQRPRPGPTVFFPLLPHAATLLRCMLCRLLQSPANRAGRYRTLVQTRESRL